MNMQNNKSNGSNKISSVLCRVVWDWIIQIALWSSIVLLIIVKTSRSTFSPFLHQLALGFFCLMYFVYFINGIFISRTFKMLLSQKTLSTVQSVLESVIKEKPEVSFKVECYHFESTNPSSEAEGTVFVDEQREFRTTTFSEREAFNYYSSRDVSGPLALNFDSIAKDQYYYVNLSLKTDITFNDALTFYDYNKQKEAFLNQYRWKDVHMDFIERKHLPGCIPDKIYKIQDRLPFCVVWQTYVVFLLLGFVELFKLYVKRFVVQLTYVVRKIISTREDLLDAKFEAHNPKLIINNAEIPFSDVVMINNDYKPKGSPEEGEVSNARQFECLIPHLNELSKKEIKSEYFVSTYRKNSVECIGTIPDYYYEKIIPDNY